MSGLEASASAGAPPRESARGALGSILLLALTITNAVAMRAVFSPVQEIAERELHFSDLQISLIQGIAASIPIGLLSLPVGRVTDRGNRARLLLALSAMWTIGTLWTVVATDFWSMFLARMLAGAGALCSLTVAISLVADLSAPARRGRALLLLSMGSMVGGAIAFASSGALLNAFAAQAPFGLAPWRAVHLTFGVVSVALTAALLLLREPPRHEISDAAHHDTWSALKEIWRRRDLLGPLFVGQITVVMADIAANVWAAPVLSRNYGQTPEQFSGWMGLVILVSGVVGALLGAPAADFGQRLKMRNGILLGAAVAAALSIPGAFFALMPDAASFACMLALLLTCGAVTGLITATGIAVLVPNEIRGVCLASFIVISAIISFGAAPTLVALIASWLSGDQALRIGLTATTAATSIAATLAFTSALRARPAA